MRRFPGIAAFIICAGMIAPTFAQEQSLRPGINDSFVNPDVREFAGRFEVESREVYTRRKEIVAACRIEPGQTVADIGAGTGLFTRMFSDAVGPRGRVIAVDIAQNFLDHILRTSREAGQRNIETLLCKADSTELPPGSVDVAFICDTYHHFEFPFKTMASLHRAMKPGGRVILVDFRRIEGKSTDWVLSHVRAGQDVFESEIVKSGFEKSHEEPDVLKENYLVVFEKAESARGDAAAPPGRGRGRGRGRDAEMRKDQEVFHFLLEHHSRIRRSVKKLENGVETLTESDDPEITAKIQEHVAAMHARVLDGRGLRFWDELFVAIFNKHASIRMTVENTGKGVRVTETSDDPNVVMLIQAHADVVSQFVAKGFEEAHQNHAVPNRKAAASSGKLEFPIVSGYGGVVVRTNAKEQPRTGAQVMFDVTADAKPAEVNQGLERAARLLNLYGAAGLRADDLKVAIVVHGEATKSVLKDSAYGAVVGSDENPNLPLIRALREAGVEVLVCGQALNRKGFADADVTEGVSIATSALTAVINRQSDGFSVLPVP